MRITRTCELDIDDPRLPELQELEHAEHVWMAFSQRQKQYKQRKANQQDKSSRKELSEHIDMNAKDITRKVKAAMRLNA
ncbi:hypothetical protein PTTG_31073, partial [Puccinia triticina 1-1 BBBD Race 1]